VTIPKRIPNHLLYTIAVDYYLSGATQEEIGEKYGISRPQISRYLRKAREEKIVEITVHPPTEIDQVALERGLEQKYGLKKAVVVPFLRRKYPPEELIRTIAISAAKTVKKVISIHQRIGIGWGKTVYQTVLAICSDRSGERPKPLMKRELAFYPLIGGLGQSLPYYQVNTMIDRMAEYYHAKSRFFSVPAMTLKGSMLPTAMREDYESIVEVWKSVDLAIIGLGGPIQQSEILKSEIDKDTIQRLIEQRAIGDILGRFFDERGVTCPTDLDSRLLGLDLERLKRIKDVVCVCGGKNKVRAIQVALEHGFFNHLITDQQTASEL